MVASKDEAYKTLIGYVDVFKNAILEANEEQQKALTIESRAKIGKLGISVIMKDLIGHRLRANLEGLPGVSVKVRYAQTQITFSSSFLMKCKQTSNGRINFIETQLMLGFMNQLQSMFPGMPSPITNIVLTFKWNKARTEIVMISILCPANEHNAYHWKLDIPLTTSPQMEPMMQPEPAPDLPTEVKRIVPKKSVKKSKRNRKSKRGLSDRDGQQGQETKP